MDTPTTPLDTPTQSSKLKSADRAVIGIFSLLAGILLVRGLSTLFTQSYTGSTRHGLIELQGIDAMLWGMGYVGLAGIVASGLLYQYSPYKRLAVWGGYLTFLEALGGFTASLML